MTDSQKRILQPEDKYVVRMPDGMRDQLKEAAKANNRSMNAEIVARLAESFEDRPTPGLRLYLLVDSQGYVQTWREVQEYLSAVKEAGDFKPQVLESVVVTPDMEFGSDNYERAWRLARWLRAGGESRPFTEDAPLNVMSYRDHVARIDFDPQRKVLVGTVMRLPEPITFTGTSVPELEERFHNAIDDFLAV